MNWLIALLACAAAATLEALLAGRDPMGQLRMMRQPVWSPPAWGWVAIGLAWYGICFVALARLIPAWPHSRLPILLLAGLMAANAAANLFQFRMRRLDLAVLLLVSYWALVLLFLWSVCAADSLICLLFGAYALYLVYGTAWSVWLWRMNRPGG